MSSKIYDAVAKAFASVDLSDLNERFATIEKGREDTEAAIARAEARCTEIALKIRDGSGPDGYAVAEALVQGDVGLAARAAGDIAELEAEKAKLREGINELRRRVNSSFDSQEAAKREALSRIGPLADPLVDELRSEAEQAAQVLLRAWTSATAISRSAASGKAERLAESLRGAIVELTNHPGVLGKQAANAHAVPDDIQALFKPLLSKGAVYRNGAVSQVSSPQGDTAIMVQNIGRLRR